ncbi:EamA family transporter [Aureispira anguillae]|nr:EamA family transporter [Aureispira anguillae]
MKLSDLRSDRYLIPISFFCIYFIWGSTYLATDWAFESFPPFFMTAIRLLMAGGLLLSVSYKGYKTATSKQIRNAAFFGFLILGIGSGGAMWSVLYLDTGMASLIVGCEPLVLVVFSWLLIGQRASMQKMLGVALGMVGMYILVSQDAITTSPDAYKGIIAVSVAIMGWTLGAIYMKGSDLPTSKIANTAIQMLTAGFVLLLVSLVLQEDIASIANRFTWKAFWSLLYLMFFGSIIAYTAFNYLLIKEDPRKVATATYINPIIALLLGWYFNNEVITSQSLCAATILILGVVFIIRDDE